ncbi:nitrate reductase molybdenum cofactor assembly chaperone [Neobacillus sp. OS1-32]|jgi:nitrate reductase delta subunit|uniref:Nitrate reductase molybdenum cofactor assembly chaperone n=1 Tax=Neobacillus paridis TaxID=2803862 RepID=A0ABS1TUG1_9BACI|nr:MULTISPECIES: nitrate reductase molybdenum cofactor assembly chaperone [Neobacillus]MBL4953921.1 nitrate reductase molybdenum cofactor assembly chaperone [Neobacillus paridis]WML31034.1 nitrate reductase molybdenum cofactor assembly chaperone [Neobacillus sp. OS1-32]
MDEHQHILGLASLLLQHPETEWFTDEQLKEEINLIDDQLTKMLFRQFYHYLHSVPFHELCANYSFTFDFNEKTTLYLTHYLFGENPDRGKALIKLKKDYDEAGLPLKSNELPDFLPLVLEFCSLAPADTAQKMLMVHRRAIDQLVKELSAIDSPYQFILQACVETIENMINKQKAS